MTTPRTVLVAEDFRAFREFVCARLGRGDLSIVSVDDGLAAVQAAADLQPDLALLDIGLPTMNGIEVARQIRIQSPTSKIVFLTQESAPEFVAAAFEMGADGYILKTRAHDYMVPVVEAMLAGQPGGDEPPRASGSGSKDRHRHHAHCFGDDSALLASAERFVLRTLAAQDAAMVALTRPHLDVLTASLRRRQATIDRAIEQGTLILIDSAETLHSVMDAALDWNRLEAGWRAAVTAAGAATAQPRPRVAAFSETGALLIASGHVETAMRLEAITNVLVAAEDLPALEVICVTPALPPLRDGLVRQICAAHSMIAIR